MDEINIYPVIQTRTTKQLYTVEHHLADIEVPPWALLNVIGECKVLGCSYYLVLLTRLTLEDEIILIPKSYFGE